jgi:hypothetical protein
VHDRPECGDTAAFLHHRRKGRIACAPAGAHFATQLTAKIGGVAVLAPHQAQGASMKLKLLVAALVVLPLCAQAQPNKAPKATKADAQKVVKLISGDQAKTKIYCDMAKLSDEAQAADEKKDTKKVEELSKKIDEMSAQLGPEYAALMDGLDNMDPNSKAVADINTELEALDKLCGK